MKNAYVVDRLREILMSANGNRVQARRLLEVAAQEDSRFLLGLVGPFLPAIIGHYVDRALGREPAEEPVRPRRSPARTLPDDALDRVVVQLERNTASDRGRPVRNDPGPTEAGSKHEQAIRALAAAYRAKRQI